MITLNPPRTDSRLGALRSLARRVFARHASAAFRCVALFLCVVAATFSARAQSAATGIVAGRVFNPSTGTYMANAEVKVTGTDLAAVTDSSGYYRISGVPVGSASVAVSYTGYQTTTATVQVAGGQTVTQDFDLRSSDAGVVKLDKFTVSSEREGNAKAIMAQRTSMNLMNSVSADIFGHTSEGNVGEFLKYLPGVDLEYVEADTRTPRLGALDPSYTKVTVNGLGFASADAFQQVNGTDNVRAGSGNRSFGFEQVSMNSIESVEINQTVSADQDPDAPAGTINLVTKRAFDRKERYIGFTANAMLNSEDPTLKKTYGPGDTATYKIKPGGTFDYDDSFLNHRLGIVANISESNMYNQQRLVQQGYNNTTTATDSRPHVVNALTFKDGPKFTERFSAFLGTDFKATDELTLSMIAGYQWYSAAYYNRQISINGSNRAAETGDGLTDFQITNDTGSASYGGVMASKLTRSYQVAPSFDYRHGDLRIDGALNYSTSTNSYEATARRLNTRDVPVNALSGLDFHLSRSAADDVNWTIAQIPGKTAASTSPAKDFSNFANYTNPRVVDDGRFNSKNIYQGLLDATLTKNWIWPTEFKAGAKVTETSNANDDFTPIYTWAYVGPGGGPTGSWAGYPSPTTFDMGVPNVNFVNLAGKTFAPTFANRNAIANLFYAHPEYFVNNSTPANWYTAEVGNHRRVREQVDAGYVMATTHINKLTLRAGLREERTTVSSVEFNPMKGADVKAAGYPVDKTGKATTLAGMVYQYTHLPKVENSGTYSDLFPSASAKYEITSNLQAQIGYSHTIRRPNYNDVGGVATIDDNAMTISIPNPNLKPEISDNVAARLAYYFEPVGDLAVSAFENHIKDASATSATPSEETQFGADYPGYTVFSHSDSGLGAVVKGMTFDYRQSLKFIPVVSNTMVFANVTRSVVDDIKKWGVPPWMVSGGFSTHFGKFSFGLNAKWTSNTPWNFTQGRFRKHRVEEDLNLGYKLTRNFSLFVNGRNITNESDYIYDFNDSRYIFKIEHYGAIWTCGVSGSF